MGEDTKRAIKAPCVFMEVNMRKGAVENVYPAVQCYYLCDSCGWNPKERERRLSTGKWRQAGVRENPETGKIVCLPETVKQLCFKKLRDEKGEVRA